MSEAGPWLALALLGVYHGLNPAMGWLFAVALGLQERRLSAVVKALVPIAVGHELSVAVVVGLVRGVELFASATSLRVVGALALVLFGIYKLFKPRLHPRWVGMRVTLPELALWSFLMSSAHGAGLMLFPLVLGLPLPAHAENLEPHGLAALGIDDSSLVTDLLAISLHTAAMLAAMAGIAVLVYIKLGVDILRKAWVNLDALWAAALIVAGLLTLFT